MNQHTPLAPGAASLLERAAEMYDFGAALRRGAPAAAPAADAVELPTPSAQAEAQPEAPYEPAPELRVCRQVPARDLAAVDREGLEEAGFILPDSPVGGLAEEFRIVKRQLLLAAAEGAGTEGGGKRRSILVCSSKPDEGKTFCAVNLALSLAAEKDLEVLLVDGDFSKPEVLSILGIEGGAGLIDAVADPSLDPESLVIRTDVAGLSVLPAGRHAANVTELLASARTRDVLSELTNASDRRIVLFDSPPALMASPASVLATHVGQVLMIVRADQTTEAELREAIGLLSGCDRISLLLNGAGFAATGRRFGSYYGYSQ